jgi:diketogulonate reductase-like aldo/keto reductase
MLGMGTYMVGEQATSWALETGYRLLDTAAMYK